VNDRTTAVRMFVLDYLRADADVPVDHLYQVAQIQFGFSRGEVDRAARSLCILARTVNKTTYVRRHPNLVAIWWAKRPRAHHWALAADGGSAA
jgi:hypothetical protein